jgi:hypothetical protein
MELTFAQWQTVEYGCQIIAGLCGLWFIGSLLYGFINDKEGG